MKQKTEEKVTGKKAEDLGLGDMIEVAGQWAEVKYLRAVGNEIIVEVAGYKRRCVQPGSMVRVKPC